MQELTIRLPDGLWRRLGAWARAQKKDIEEVVIERLETIPNPERANLQQRYERFFEGSGLFLKASTDEKRSHRPVSYGEREEIARKFSIGKPLSEVIREERR